MTDNGNMTDDDGGDTRPARTGETDTTRFGMEPGDNTDTPSPPLGATPAPQPKEQGGQSAGLATGLQPRGLVPGGGPGAMTGSLGTGGGSNADRETGDPEENNIQEDVR